MKDIEQVGNDFKSFDDMVKAHRGVLKSLIDKDNYYKMNIHEFNKVINDLTFTKEKKRVHTHLTIKQTTN